MKIAYHLATPPAPVAELDAAVQEIERLRSEFGGSLDHLYPASSYRWWIPRRWPRAAVRQALREADRTADLHHIVTDRVFPFPCLRSLRKPVVCSLLTPPDRRPRSRDTLDRLDRIVVSSSSDIDRLGEAGRTRAQVIPPAIDLQSFVEVPAPPLQPFTLMMASAPWTRRQFATKGVDTLLAALRARPSWRLILLWRSVLEREVEERIRAADLEGRVELVRDRVDVAQMLKRVHVVVLAPTSPRVVRSYPHSLLESLAAGRPIVTSRHLAISELVRDHDGGRVCESSSEALVDALDSIEGDYGLHRKAARRLDLGAFAPQAFLRSWRRLYEAVLTREPSG